MYFAMKLKILLLPETFMANVAFHPMRFFVSSQCKFIQEPLSTGFAFVRLLVLDKLLEICANYSTHAIKFGLAFRHILLNKLVFYKLF